MVKPRISGINSTLQADKKSASADDLWCEKWTSRKDGLDLRADGTLTTYVNQMLHTKVHKHNQSNDSLFSILSWWLFVTASNQFFGTKYIYIYVRKMHLLTILFNMVLGGGPMRVVGILNPLS